MRLMIAVAAAAMAFAGPTVAQVTNTPAPLTRTSEWTYSVTPYVWLPTLSTTLNHRVVGGGSASTTISAGIGDYFSDLNFALMGGAEARHDRFSIMTDLVYANASISTANVHLSTFNPGPGPIDIPRSQQLNTSTRFASTIWSVAGGYTVLQGEWGNVDAVAGLRLLVLSDTTNYALTAGFILPNRTVGLSRRGSLGLDATNVEGIGGIKGRINLAGTRVYVPFYADVGGGGVPLTWQVYAGIGYRAARWAELSVGYRYLAFAGSSNASVRKLSLGGVVLAGSFRF